MSALAAEVRVGRGKCFLSSLFSDTVGSVNSPFRVCVRTRFSSNLVERKSKNPAPEGRPNLAQRFSAGKVGERTQVPESLP
jgi:hypothetical protein